MQTLEIGRTGIFVPPVGMGTWAIGGGSWWGNQDDAISVSAIQRAIDLGIVWLDTAPIYGLFHSEEVVGKAIAGRRDRVVLSTKCGLEWRHQTPIHHKTVDGTDVYRDLSKASIMEDVEGSLQRLGTDYLDVLYTHWQTTDVSLYPVEETLDAFLTLKKQGKIRAIGACNVTPEFVRAYQQAGGLDVIQEKYSIMTRRVEKDLLPLCRELGISLQAYSPLEQGLLTGKVTMESVYPEGNTRNSNPNFKPDRRRKALDLLERWSDLSEKYHCSKGNLVIAFTAAHAFPVHVLCGARTVEQVEDNANAMHLSLDSEDLARMEQDILDLHL